jgi:hypothetical protein
MRSLESMSAECRVFVPKALLEKSPPSHSASTVSARWRLLLAVSQLVAEKENDSTKKYRAVDPLLKSLSSSVLELGNSRYSFMRMTLGGKCGMCTDSGV